MAKIILSEAALLDSKRIFDFLASGDQAGNNLALTDIAERAGAAIADSIAMLEDFPLLAPTLEGKIRILSVPFGKRGYSVAYIYEQCADEVIVLGIKHQTEEYFPFELEGENDGSSTSPPVASRCHR